MTPEDVEVLSLRLEDWTGIDMRRGGLVPALQRYIDTRAKALGVSPHALGKRIDSPQSPETRALLDALTVGHTWFFRDATQLQTLAGLLRRDRTNHVWIPACATGEEPYTVAMIAMELNADVRILATDINSDFLRLAEVGRYGEWAVRDVPLRGRNHFRHEDGAYIVHEDVKKRVRFERHNVRDPAPQGAWDLVLCRNMLIYFSHHHATETVARFANALAPDGALIVGAADLNFDCPPSLVPQSVEGRWLLRKGTPVRAREPWTLQELPRIPVVAVPKRFDLSEALNDAHQRLFAGDLRGAAPICARIVAEEPLCAEGHWLLGVLHDQAGRASDALHSLRAALLLSPRFWPAAHYLERLAPPAEAHAALLTVASAESISGSGRPLLEQMEALRTDFIRRAERKLMGGTPHPRHRHSRS